MKFAKVMFLQVSVCPQEGHTCTGGMGGGVMCDGGGRSGLGGSPPGTPVRPLLRAIRILLECILVYCKIIYRQKFKRK